MGLLKGTGNEEVEINCTAYIETGKPGSKLQVRFISYFRKPADMSEIREVREKLNDDDLLYDDEHFVEEYFLRFDKMPAPDGGWVEFNEESRHEVMQERDYFIAIAKACAAAVFGTEGRRKN